MKPERLVVIADGQALCREGLVRIFARADDAWTPGGVGSLSALLASLSAGHAVTMIVVDLELPGLNGVMGVRRLRAQYPHVKLVVTAAAFERQDIIDCLTAGVHGCICKSSSSSEIANAVITMRSGRIYVPPLSSDELPEERLPVAPKLLSGRQREILEVLVTGKSNKEIARKLGIAEGTVKAHVNAIFRTLGVRNRSGAVAAFGGLLRTSSAWEPSLPGFGPLHCAIDRELAL